MSNIAHQTTKLQQAKPQKPKKNKLEKLKDYLYGDREKLSKSQKETFDRLKQASAIIAENPIKTDVLAAIESKFGVGDRQALRIYNDARSLFGDTQKVDREAAKYAIYVKQLKIAEDLYNLHVEALADGEVEVAGKMLDKSSQAFDRACALYDLKAAKEEKIGINAKQFFRQLTVVRTTDPRVARKEDYHKWINEGDSEATDITDNLPPETISFNDLD